MAKKQKKKKDFFKKIIGPILLCLLIQAGLVYGFTLIIPSRDPIKSTDLEKVTIVVEETDCVYRGSAGTEFRVYADGVWYPFRSRTLSGEVGSGRLEEKIQPGDVITLFYLKESSRKLIIGAYSDTETYRSVEQYNKSTKMAFIPCIFLCVILESIYLSLSGLYFSSEFRKMFSKKGKKRKNR